MEQPASVEIIPAGSLELAHMATGAGLVEAFLDGRTRRTLEAYGADLEDFRAFIGAATVADAAHELLSRGHGAANAQAQAYKAHLMERGLSAATVNRRLAALRSLVRMAGTFALISWRLEVENLAAEPRQRRPAAAHKVRATYHLPEDVVQAARNTAVALSGPPQRLTLSALVEAALRSEVERLQTTHNRGKPYPRVEEPLVGGRPLGSSTVHRYAEASAETASLIAAALTANDNARSSRPRWARK